MSLVEEISESLPLGSCLLGQESRDALGRWNGMNQHVRLCAVELWIWGLCQML